MTTFFNKGFHLFLQNFSKCRGRQFCRRSLGLPLIPQKCAELRIRWYCRSPFRVAGHPQNRARLFGSVVLPKPRDGLPFLPLKMCRARWHCRRSTKVAGHPLKPCTSLRFGGTAEAEGRVAISSPKNVQGSVALPTPEGIANYP